MPGLFHLRLAAGPPLYDFGPTSGQKGYQVLSDGRRILVNSRADIEGLVTGYHTNAQR